VFILEERETHSKQLQFVSGVKPYMYWTANFLWDLMNYVVPIILCIFIFLIFNVKTYLSPENFPCLVLVMLLYGWACIPLMYPLNYIFKIPSTAFVVTSCLNIFIGVVTTMTTTILMRLGDDDPQLADINAVLKIVFVIIFPHYCLGDSFLQMSILYNEAEVRRAFDLKTTYSPLQFNKAGRNLLALFLQGIAFFILNLLIQYKFFIKINPKTYIDNKLLSRKNKNKNNNLNDNDQQNDDNNGNEIVNKNDEDDDVYMERKRINLVHNTNHLNKNKNKKMKRIHKFRSNSVVDMNNNINNNFHLDELEKNKNKIDSSSKDYVKLVNLTKIYRKLELKKMRIKRHVAVNKLSIGINKGNSFTLICFLKLISS
jgi:hypothetical protein